MNPFSEVNWNPGFAEKRKFAESCIVGFPLLAAFFSLITWLATHTWKPFFLWLGVIGFAVGMVLWLLPAIARPFYLAWYFIACCIAFVIGNVLLVAFYYMIITPIGLLLQGSGKLSLQKSFDKETSTYWVDVKKRVDFNRYYRQF
jgi:thiol:disulfide interchange protein